MFHGVHGEFKWLETPAHHVHDVLQVCPSVVADKNVVVTSFDPAKLKPMEENWLRGCRVAGSALHLPPVNDPETLPYRVFDEWYVFSSSAPEKTFKRFLNYEWLTLGPAQVFIFVTILPGT